MNIAVRPANKEDAAALLSLIEALADYESLPRPDLAARERFVEHSFGAHRFFKALLAERDSQPVGYALYFFTYSSFLAQPTLYIEDVFVRPEHRRHGIGTALMRSLVREAREAGCGRVEWQVLHWNHLAIDFYRKLGARRLEEWLPYRLDRQAMETLLEEQPR